MVLTKDVVIRMIQEHNSTSTRPLPKYIMFCFVMIDKGYQVTLLKSKSAVSKYVYVRHIDKEIKVRFSNHRPNSYKEHTQDADFYAGVSNTNCITTEEIIKEIIKLFEKGNKHAT